MTQVGDRVSISGNLRACIFLKKSPGKSWKVPGSPGKSLEVLGLKNFKSSRTCKWEKSWENANTSAPITKKINKKRKKIPMQVSLFNNALPSYDSLVMTDFDIETKETFI